MGFQGDFELFGENRISKSRFRSLTDDSSFFRSPVISIVLKISCRSLPRRFSSSTRLAFSDNRSPARSITASIVSNVTGVLVQLVRLVS
jgi:hypothetical protein